MCKCLIYIYIENIGYFRKYHNIFQPWQIGIELSLVSVQCHLWSTYSRQRYIHHDIQVQPTAGFSMGKLAAKYNDTKLLTNQHIRLNPVSIHQMAPPERTSDNSSLLIYWPWKDMQVHYSCWRLTFWQCVIEAELFLQHQWPRCTKSLTNT